MAKNWHGLCGGKQLLAFFLMTKAWKAYLPSLLHTNLIIWYVETSFCIIGINFDIKYVCNPSKFTNSWIFGRFLRSNFRTPKNECKNSKKVVLRPNMETLGANLPQFIWFITSNKKSKYLNTRNTWQKIRCPKIPNWIFQH